MHVMSTRFTLPEATDWDAMRRVARERAELYVGVPGLVSKAFVVDPEAREYGADYVWESREAAERFLAGDLFRSAVEKLGRPRTSLQEVAAYLERGRITGPQPVSPA